MLDFVKIKQKSEKQGVISVYPEFIVKNSKDLMTRGRGFYAIWDEKVALWSKSETKAKELIDFEIKKFARDLEEVSNGQQIIPILLENYSTKKWIEFQNYCKSLPDNYKELDAKIIFGNTDVKKEDYCTRKLPYFLNEGDISAYEDLMNVLYSENDRRKIEWIIGSIISGDSKNIQKFGVFYGGPGTGKSTVLNIIEQLFPGYYTMFESKILGSSNSSFALESFSSNPLIAIEHDGDLSRIEDNSKLNSIVSHETMVINEKFKSKYTARFNSFILMGTNKPVKITDAKSGLLRRLIDIVPTGNTIPKNEYDQIISQIPFELGAIAKHCLDVYNDLGINYYNGYVPRSMMSTTNDFYNFIEDNFDFFKNGEPSEEGNYITLNSAWNRYNEYCLDSKIPYPFQKRVFKEELKNYFSCFKLRHGQQKNVYIGFLSEKLDYEHELTWDEERKNDSIIKTNWLNFNCDGSLMDELLKDCPAQYSNENGTPIAPWASVKTCLKDIDTKKLHYVKVPNNLIIIDFDIKNEDGEKDFKINFEKASKWPKTYAELSKSGNGIHLHYFYDGDPNELSRIYEENVEIKVYNGNSALRRMVTLCNDIPISNITSGLPLKGERPMLQDFTIRSERDLRSRIQKNLRKEIHSSTRCSMDFIYKILEEAYESGLKYDVTDMRNDIQQFALQSTHQANYCLKLINKMHFCSDEPSENVEDYKKDQPIVIFDCEVFPNLLLVSWKKKGEGSKVNRMYNPSPSEIEEFIKFRIAAYNGRRYDNHILYARMMGYSEEELFKLSQRIINDHNGYFQEAYNLSYTDIYDFLSAQNKMSLKKWEIKLHIRHKECPYKWDQSVPKEKWEEIGDYCDNDVIAAEKVWDANEADWIAREILADWAGMTVNDTTNALTTKIIFGDDPHPQREFVYTDLSTIFPGYRFNSYGIPKEEYDEGAKIVSGKSIYRGEDPSEGGKVSSKPGMYTNVVVLDVLSMHPHAAIALNIFGDRYTKKFENIVEGRVEIKNKDFEKAKSILPEKVHKYLDDLSKAKKLANGLKTAINCVYGLTSASFDNKMKDPRNKDNIVAKYGALFMINLRHEVEDHGWEWVHIKTDSIKIANATPEAIDFVKEYGKKYGFTFVHESTYAKMCLVNESTYIALVSEEDGKKLDVPKWTATGAQFQVPYVFKSLFTKEKIEFEDLCETKSASTSLYLDMISDPDLPFHDYRFVGKVGSFCPIKPGCGGGILLREDGKVPGKYAAVTGTKKKKIVNKDDPKVFYWLESEMVETLKKQDDIDMSYFRQLVDEAIESISKYGDFDWFASDDISKDIGWMKIPDQLPDDKEELPFDDEWFETVMNPPKAKVA